MCAAETAVLVSSDVIERAWEGDADDGTSIAWWSAGDVGDVGMRAGGWLSEGWDEYVIWGTMGTDRALGFVGGRRWKDGG